MFNKILKVEALDNLTLKVDFENGITKLYDIKPLFEKWEVFNILQNISVFKAVQVDAGGHGISWCEDIDLSCNELWDNGKTI